MYLLLYLIFLGLEIHPSDEIIHWTDSKETALKIRQAWSNIPEELWPCVKILMEQSHKLAHIEEIDKAAGEGL